MFPCLCAQGSSIAEYLDFSRIAVKRDTCVLVCLYALRGFTRPSYISTGGGDAIGGGGVAPDPRACMGPGVLVSVHRQGSSADLDSK